MNKKIISILLIFSLLTVGLTSVTANETNELSSNDVSVANIENPSSSTGTNNTVNSENNSTVDDNSTEVNQTNNTNSSDVNGTVKYNKLMELLNKLDHNNADKFLGILSSSNNTHMLELYETLYNFDDDNPALLLFALENLTDEEYDAVIALLIALTDDSDNSSSQATYHPIQKVRNSDTTSTSVNDNSDNIINRIFAPKKSVTSNSDEKSESDVDNVFDDLIFSYFVGLINFDQLVSALNYLGYDTSNMELNPDGTFTWDGYLFTEEGMFIIDTSSNNTVTNSTNLNTNTTSANNNITQNTPTDTSSIAADNSEVSTNDNSESTENK